VSPPTGCPLHKPTGGCSGEERSCLYSVRTNCRCNQHFTQWRDDPQCRPSPRRENLIEQCERKPRAPECAELRAPIPWSCSCSRGQWRCSRLAANAASGYQVVEDPAGSRDGAALTGNGA
jgi:hypothetical protein